MDKEKKPETGSLDQSMGQIQETDDKPLGTSGLESAEVSTQLLVSLADSPPSLEELLRQTEDRFRRLATLLPAILCELSADGTTLFVNSAVTKVSGYAPEQLLRKNWWNIFYPGDLHRQVDEIYDQFGSGDVVDYEMVMAAKDGSQRTVAWTYVNHYLSDGSLKRILGFGIDITERKKAQVALEEREELFHELFQNANDAILLHGITPDGRPDRFIEVNDLACRRLGYTREELLQMTPRDIVAEEHRNPDARRSMGRLLADGQATFERVNAAKDGRRIPVEISTHTFDFRGKKVVLSISRDITERKRSEQQIKESEEKYKNLVELATDIIYINDRDGNRIFLNDAAFKLLEISPEEAIGKPWSEMVHPEDIESSVRKFVEMIEQGIDIFNFENRYLTKSGKVIHALHNVRLLRDENGEITGVQGIARDITDRKVHEQKLAYWATHDPLTGLPNRRLLEEAIGRVVARTHRGGMGALLFLDVDNFKMVNDSLGHAAGDRALEILGRVLQNQLRAEDLLARVGGDEFAVLLEGANLETARGVAERMRQMVEEFELRVEDTSFKLSLSMGLVTISDQETHLEVLTQADAAMYKAKEQGGNQIVLWWSD